MTRRICHTPICPPLRSLPSLSRMRHRQQPTAALSPHPSAQQGQRGAWWWRHDSGGWLRQSCRWRPAALPAARRAGGHGDARRHSASRPAATCCSCAAALCQWLPRPGPFRLEAVRFGAGGMVSAFPSQAAGLALAMAAAAACACPSIFDPGRLVAALILQLSVNRERFN